MIHAVCSASELVLLPKHAAYLANPVFLVPRKITMVVVMMTSTDADSVTPEVKTHWSLISFFTTTHVTYDAPRGKVG